MTKYKNGEYVLHLEITEVVFGHCNIINKYFQQDLKDLHKIIPNRLLGQLRYLS